MAQKEAEELALAHWEYVEKVLEHTDLKPNEIENIGFHYITAFIHGYKHGKERE